MPRYPSYPIHEETIFAPCPIVSVGKALRAEELHWNIPSNSKYDICIDHTSRAGNIDAEVVTWPESWDEFSQVDHLGMISCVSVLEEEALVVN